MTRPDTPQDALTLIETAILHNETDQALDPKTIANATARSEYEIVATLQWLEDTGLVYPGLEDGEPPSVTNAGRQYQRRNGDVPGAALRFLTLIDDLDGRQALLEATTILIDEYSYQLGAGTAVAHARELVPAAFGEAVDERLAIQLYAAAIALTTRLAHEAPAACVAEEILALHLIEIADGVLEARVEGAQLSATDAERARQAIRGGLFALFGDDDVLEMLDMREPADAAVREDDPGNQTAGVVDQRVENWFVAFGSESAVGYLGGGT